MSKENLTKISREANVLETQTLGNIRVDLVKYDIRGQLTGRFDAYGVRATDLRNGRRISLDELGVPSITQVGGYGQAAAQRRYTKALEILGRNHV